MSCGAKILLKDRYRALKLLGQGGFGKTFKAVDEDMLFSLYIGLT
jgi:serine/threonine protein kinase